MQAETLFDDPFAAARLRMREKKSLDRSRSKANRSQPKAIGWTRILHAIRLAIPISFIGLGALLILSLPLAAPAKPIINQRLGLAGGERSVALKLEALTPQAIKPLTADEAIAANALIPLSSNSLRPGMSLYLPGDDKAFGQALNCLTSAVYYEAASESIDGQRAVAQVVINRVRHPAFPSSICGVVFQGSERRTGCQFSFTCDGSLRRKPMLASWLTAEAVAREALAGSVYVPVGLSTHYHADYVVPYWASSLVKSAAIGRHIFYRWNGKWGTSNAFVQRYMDAEPVIGMLDSPQLATVEQGLLPMFNAQERSVLDLSGGALEPSPASAGPEISKSGSRAATSSEAARYVIPMGVQAEVQLTMVPH